MKGTVLRPVWPAPGRSDSNASRTRDFETANRLSLALLEDYAIDSKSRGFDPYNTDAGRKRGPARQDLWSRKSKRD